MSAFVHKKPRYSVRETCQLLGFGRTKFHELINNGLLESSKDGSRRFVTAEAIERYLARFRQ